MPRRTLQDQKESTKQLRNPAETERKIDGLTSVLSELETSMLFGNPKFADACDDVIEREPGLAPYVKQVTNTIKKMLPEIAKMADEGIPKDRAIEQAVLNLKQPEWQNRDVQKYFIELLNTMLKKDALTEQAGDKNENHAENDTSRGLSR